MFKEAGWKKEQKDNSLASMHTNVYWWPLIFVNDHSKFSTLLLYK